MIETAIEAIVCLGVVLQTMLFAANLSRIRNRRRLRNMPARPARLGRALTGDVITADLGSGEVRLVKLAGFDRRRQLPSKKTLERFLPGPRQPIWIETIYEDQEGKITGNVYRNRQDRPSRISINRNIAKSK